MIIYGLHCEPAKTYKLVWARDRAHEVFYSLVFKDRHRENLKQRMIEYLCTKLIF